MLLAAGVLSGLVWSALAPAQLSRKANAHTVVDAGLVALVGALVAARIAFVVLHWEWFNSRTLEIAALWQGGLAGWAAPIGAAAGVLAYSRLRAVDPWPVADRLAGPATLVAFAAWTGCLLDGCAYGMRLPPSILAPVSTDMLGTLAPRWPTQTVAAVACAVSLFPVLRLRQRRPGTAAAMALAIQSAIAWSVSQFRADPVVMVGVHRSDSLGWALVGLAAFLLLLILSSSARAQSSE